ncbi:hypothetical protein CAL14_17550 [Bordetella genomosp. 9]|uniref:hypothetical protein n=1 Tax=Bordetella genomosp. 9 TaxID=1416803 RepID=UPI000A28D54F|nr:hypothetical protein [Bordetella genomosp. 9]ARP91868.1 hypothetical protein CAL14_17550 [Bordetella genomosp. 9]
MAAFVVIAGDADAVNALNRLMKSKRKLKERLEQDRSDLEAKIVALAITVNFTNVKRVEIKGYAAGVKELGVLVAEEAKKAMAAKLGVDPGVIHVSGGGGSDPVVGVKVRVIG